ncbi:DUF4365 domain-containing protein [Jeotgalibacillus sp. JSM ZJ347]|uniref:DUF4365 domain-containing protein n=1 Tax=Jeotgalibacillus sp. JSM ZJ347 TaxID=3342117 RepID=UPI0035A8BFCD
MDKVIIEHLACMEINYHILQPPYRLISNVKWNDKGLSFDGDVEIYNGAIEKANFKGRVPVQVKGTTTFKKVNKKNKIKHSVAKKDLEVYYKDGQGVLYFVVTINKATRAKQAYYRRLAPLDLKGILYQLKNSGNETISISFKVLNIGELESICINTLRVVESQPKHLIEASHEKDFTNYKIRFHDTDKEGYNLFEESVYLYGILNNYEIPLNSVLLKEIKMGNFEVVEIDNNSLVINYNIRESEDKIIVIIENTLTLEVYKEVKTGKLHIDKIKSIDSYLKCLYFIKYHIEKGKLPFNKINLGVTITEKDLFDNLSTDIKFYEEMKNIFNQIGISANYEFDKNEDLEHLFTDIIEIFNDKKLDRINFEKDFKIEDMIFNLELSNYIKIKVMYSGNKFINMFSKEALSIVGGFTPKSEIKFEQEFSEWKGNDWNDKYWKVSIFTPEKINDLEEMANFNFDIFKLSFTEEFHDIESDVTINKSLDCINYYDSINDERYLDLALELNEGYLEKDPESDIAKININLIKIKKRIQLSTKDEQEIFEILEKAEKKSESSICFACEVILGNKHKSNKIFNSLSKTEQEALSNLPIYKAFQALIK